MVGCTEKSAESHLVDARAFVSQQQIDAAIVEYKNAIQKAPDSAEARAELGKLYIQKNNFIAAEKELNRALELGYPASEIIPILSLAYQQTGAENALMNIDHAAEGMTAVESAEVGFYKLQSLVRLNKPEEARALLTELSTLDTSSVYKGLIDSYTYILDNDLEGAVAATEQLREQAPSNRDVLQQLASLYLQQNESDKAIDVYSSYMKSYPEDIANKFTYAALLVQNQQLAKADPIVDELLKLNENHPLLNTFKGIIESAKGNFAKALEHLEVAVQNGRNDQVVRLVAGFSAYQIQDFEAAQRHLTMVASSLPDNHPGLRMLADSMLQLGENDEALEVLARVEGEQTSDAALFSKASYQLLKDGNVVGAKKMVEKTETVSSTAEDLSRLGVLQLSLNDIEGLVNLEQAVEKAPESVTTQNTLIRAYIATNQLDKAKQAAEQWHQTSPKTAVPLVYLGSIAIAQKEFDKAQSYLDQAGQLDDANNEVEYAKIKLLIAQDKKDEAMASVRNVIKAQPTDIQALTIWYALAAEKGQTQDVLVHAQKQLDSNTDDLNLRILLARFYSLEGSLDKTHELLAEVQGDGASPLSYWNLKGQTLIALNKVDDAVAFFDSWLSFYPQDLNAVLGKLLILDATRQFEEALTLTNNVLKKRADTRLSLLKAYFHTRLAQPKPAWDIVNSATDEVKALPFVQGVIARLKLLDGNASDAVDNAKVAYEATPNADNALLLLAIYENSDNAEQGYNFLTQHVKDNAQDIQSTMLLAERQIQRDRASSIATYEDILKRSPDNFVVLNNLAYLAYEDGDLSKAESLAKRAVSLQGQNADAVDTLAQIYIAKGEKDAALALYEEISIRPIPNEEVYLNHVELLLSMDKKTLAKRRLASREFTSDTAKARVEALKAKYNI
ncbi:hypothetical protein D210916BOD24_02890 [Alteromonas sp. D210916BOD_24]